MFNPSIPLAWFGVILINIAFGSLVTYTTLISWPIGVGICLFYTIVLFLMARAAQKKQANVIEEGGNTNGLPVLINILFLLGVFAIGVTGLIIPLNLVRCEDSSTNTLTDDYRNEPSCNTDTSTLPTEEVRQWCENRNRYSPETFVYLPTSGITLFQANWNNQGEELWKIGASSDRKPQLFSDWYPSQFTLVSNGTACFLLADQKDTYSQKVACSDGETLRYSPSDFQFPHNLFSQDGVLWLRDDDTIASIDPSTDMEATLYKKLDIDTDDDDDVGSDCDDFKIARNRALYSVFASILPTILASLLIWKKHGIPSMPVTLYLGIGALIIAFYLCYDPLGPHTLDISKWWFALSSAAWLFGLFVAFLTNRIREDTMSWGIHFSSAVYFVFMILLIGVPGAKNDDAWRWILVNLVIFFPLIFLSVVTKYYFLLILGAIGLFIDAWKISYELDRLVDGVEFFIQFGVFATAGLGIGYMGWILNKVQLPIQNAVEGWANRWLSGCKKKGNVGVVEDSAEPDETNTAEMGSVIDTAVTA